MLQNRRPQRHWTDNTSTKKNSKLEPFAADRIFKKNSTEGTQNVANYRQRW